MKREIFTLSLLALSLSLSAQEVHHHRKHQEEGYNKSIADTLKFREIEDIRLHKTGNPNKAQSLTTKSNLTVMETPSAISMVTHEIIEQQQAKQLSEVLQNVNGLYVTSARGGAQDNFGARGFIFRSDNLFKNGSRVNSVSFPEVEGLERVEVLKGGNAMLYGNTAAGGVVNMVTKKPRFYFGGSAGINVGSWNNYKPFVDVYGPLSKNVAVRVNGTYEYADSFRDVVNSQKHYFNPSVLFNLGKNTQLIVEADYLKHRSTPDFGVGSITYPDKHYEINRKLPRNAFASSPWQYQDVQQLSADIILNTQLASKWTLNAVAAYQNYTRDYFSSERMWWIYKSDSKIEWERSLGRSYTESNYASLQFNVNGEFKTGNVKHKVLLGADGDYVANDSYSFDILDRKTNAVVKNDGIAVLNDPSTWASKGMPLSVKTKLSTTPSYRAGAYVQDFIGITNELKVLAGVRFSYIENRLVKTYDYQKNIVKDAKGISSTYRAYSPKIGLVYAPNDNLSVFANYTNSFVPNDGTTASGTDKLDLTKTPNEVKNQIANLNRTAIQPSIIDQYEVGVKKNLFSGALSVNLTAYQITNRNEYSTYNYVDAAGKEQVPDRDFKVAAGMVKSRGIELDITGNPTKSLSIIGGFAYNDTRYLKTPADGYVENQRVVRTPAITANGSVFYTFQDALKGLKIGATAYYIADRLGGWNDTKPLLKTRNGVTRLMKLDNYSTVALSLGYDSRKFSIMGKVSNLFNTLDYVVHENYSVNPLAPRNYYLTFTYKL